jgi:hypothetical protein
MRVDVPGGEASAGLAPGVVLRRVAQMRADGGRNVAAALLDAIGGGRAAPEVAGVVEALDADGATEDVDRVLRANARRPGPAAIPLLEALAERGRMTLLARARRALADAGRPRDAGRALAAWEQLVEPRLLAGRLMSEPAGIVVAALTRLVATDGAARHVTAVLDAIAARPSRAVRWIGRLSHVAPEPGGAGGRRPDLVDRYLRCFLRRHPADVVAGLVRELDYDGSTAAALRLVREVRLDVHDHARRFAIARPLHDSPRGVALWNAWSEDPAEVARAAAVDELYRRLGDGVLPGAVAGEPSTEWAGRLSLVAGERPLWLMTLHGGLADLLVVGFGSWGLHVSAGVEQRAAGIEDFRIAYGNLAELVFRMESSRIRLIRQAPPGEPAQSFSWPVDVPVLGADRVWSLVALLNQVADAVRRAYAAP